MKKCVCVTVVLVLTVSVVGCSKKKQSMLQTQEPMSMDELAKMDAPGNITPEEKTQTPPSGPSVSSTSTAAPILEKLPPSGPYRPTAVEIQTALKNAGYYAAAVDGKIGPKTGKAVEDFQKANGLTADGKVGPKTWAVLSKHLNPEPTAPVNTAVPKKR